MDNQSRTTMATNQAARDLLSLDCIQFNVQNPFTWVSGIKAPIYCDNRRINSNVTIRSRMAEAFVEVIKENLGSVDTIAGVATGGLPMGTLVADRMNLPF